MEQWLIQAVIFDMDGLLTESESRWRIAEREACAELGLPYTDDDFDTTMGVRMRQITQLWFADHPWEGPSPDHVADQIAGEKVVGFMQGRMEFGPRALGHRSILADPTRSNMKDLLNKYVKFREELRPFAPSVLAEHANEYFENCTDSPFMLFVYPVRPEKQHEVPAITHIDGTARVQTVTEAANPRYHALIKAFADITGTPMLLNTSFNVMGEPIVHKPADAIRCFYSTGMDVLAMGDYLIVKAPTS